MADTEQRNDLPTDTAIKTNLLGKMKRTGRSQQATTSWTCACERVFVICNFMSKKIHVTIERLGRKLGHKPSSAVKTCATDG